MLSTVTRETNQEIQKMMYTIIMYINVRVNVRGSWTPDINNHTRKQLMTKIPEWSKDSVRIRAADGDRKQM